MNLLNWYIEWIIHANAAKTQGENSVWCPNFELDDVAVPLII